MSMSMAMGMSMLSVLPFAIDVADIAVWVRNVVVSLVLAISKDDIINRCAAIRVVRATCQQRQHRQQQQQSQFAFELNFKAGK